MKYPREQHHSTLHLRTHEVSTNAGREHHHDATLDLMLQRYRGGNVDAAPIIMITLTGRVQAKLTRQRKISAPDVCFFFLLSLGSRHTGSPIP